MKMSKEDSDEIENMPFESAEAANGGVKGHPTASDGSTQAVDAGKTDLGAASTTCSAASLAKARQITTLLSDSDCFVQLAALEIARTLVNTEAASRSVFRG